MGQGLPVSRLISVQVDLTPAGAQFANFNSLLIVGDTDVIDVDERIRSYGSMEDVAAEFSDTDPEFLAAELFFGQIPSPEQLYIGRWAQSATAGILVGGILTPAQKTLSIWTGITDGSFQVTVDGGANQNITGLDFHLETNLNGVAGAISSALAGAVCTWDGDRFRITSDTTGDSSAVSFVSSGSGGTDIALMLRMTEALASRAVPGQAAESAIDAVTILAGLSTKWYGLMVASPNVVDGDHVDIAGFVQATGLRHIYGLTTDDTNALDPSSTSDIGYVLAQAGYTRTFGEYSSTTSYAAASVFGRAFTVNFEAQNSTITLMYKQQPGVTPEDLTDAQAAALDAKRYMYYANYNNGVAITANGTMFGRAYFDEIHGLDWLADRVQTDLFNVLFTTETKIPQTDAGNAVLAGQIEADCAAAANNGLVAPGQWNSGGFGQLKRGQFLDKGYYVYAPPIASQPQADRDARKSVAFQVAVKLAGAIHDVDVIINVNR